ncbi:MAG: hypothetical protein KGI28_08830 [Thaumarchaeota archaeon]|nr:hypothetical protein [Nitrososphaerota archaeon]
MENPDDLVGMIDECIKLLDENVDILNDIDYSLESQKEDVMITDLTKNDLVNMAHEVSDSSRIKRAESDFVRRLIEKKSD